MIKIYFWIVLFLERRQKDNAVTDMVKAAMIKHLRLRFEKESLIVRALISVLIDKIEKAKNIREIIKVLEDFGGKKLI